MPLTEKINFKTRLQRGNRLQIPRLIRWQFKLETDQVMKVSVSVVHLWGGRESFPSRMGKDGRVVVPKLILALLKCDKPSLEGCVMDVTIEPF